MAENAPGDILERSMPDVSAVDNRTAEVLHPIAANAPVRHFLFVTAPFGGFSRQLARLLRREGALCSRILLNGGDLADWGVSNAKVYRNGQDAWPTWIQRYLVEEGVSDLITH